MIPYARQKISKTDINEVTKVLKSNYLTQGPCVPKFEKAVAKYCSASFAVAVNNATNALHIACLALDLGPNDWLWTSPNTFVASANCGRYCGAQIDFIDIDYRTYNISIAELSKKLEYAKKNKKLPKIIIIVHFAGQPCDMKSIYNLSKIYGFKIIEDASHAIGSEYNKKKTGSCTYSDVTVFSFHPVKIITTAEGGMALTNDKKIAEKLINLRTHGIINDPKKMKKRPKNEIWNYQQIELGFNYRMNDIQAALGLSQMRRLDSFVRCRHKIANRYNKEFKNFPITIPWQSPKAYSSFHLYPILIKRKTKSRIQKKIYSELKKNNIGVNLHYIPVHRHPYYVNLGFKKNDFPIAEKFHQNAISLPMYVSLSLKKQKRVIDTLKILFKKYY